MPLFIWLCRTTGTKGGRLRSLSLSIRRLQTCVRETAPERLRLRHRSCPVDSSWPLIRHTSCALYRSWALRWWALDSSSPLRALDSCSPLASPHSCWPLAWPHSCWPLACWPLAWPPPILHMRTVSDMRSVSAVFECRRVGRRGMLLGDLLHSA